MLLDYVEIDQVLTNLVENAAKYHTPPGGDITVSVSRGDDEVQIGVADRGRAFHQGSSVGFSSLSIESMWRPPG